MMIDTHCHVDQFPSPETVVRECENKRIRVVAVTNIPSHFAVAADRLRDHPLLSPALGMHPMAASEAIRELAAFRRMAEHTDFIGEVGLDFSQHGHATKGLQERLFEEVLRVIANRQRFVTLHSRGAEMPVAEALRRHKIRAAVFHWFTGNGKELERVISDGHFISLNPAMLSTESGKRIVAGVPKESVLVESDGPFAKIGGRTSNPRDIAKVYDALSLCWKMNLQTVVELVANNFSRITKVIADDRQNLHNQSRRSPRPKPA